MAETVAGNGASSPTGTEDKYPGLDLTPEERAILDNVDQAYDNGKELVDWWQRTYSEDSFSNRFPLIKEFDRPDRNFGFLETAELASGTQPLMGELQDLFFDHPKSKDFDDAHQQEWSEEVREFVFKHFLCVTSSRKEEAFPDDRPQPSRARWASQCPEDREQRQDIGFLQLFYKSAEDGRVGRFSQAEQARLGDMRDIGLKYDWILAKARLYDFQVQFFPFGRSRPPLVIQDNQEQLYVLFTPYLQADRQAAPGEALRDDGILGNDNIVAEFGMGFSIVSPPPQSPFAFGPTVFTKGFNYFRFRVLEDGEVRVQIGFCCNQLDALMPLPVNPAEWTVELADRVSLGTASRWLKPLRKQLNRLPLGGATVDPVFGSIDLLNRVTGGQAARDYCISRHSVFKAILRKHGMVFDRLVGNASRVWRQIPDWRDDDNLPAWVIGNAVD